MTRPLRSAPITGTSPLLRAGPPATPNPKPAAWPVPAINNQNRVRSSLLTFHVEAADQAHVTCMPDTAWPISGHPPGSSRSTTHHPGSDVNELFRHVSSDSLALVFLVPT